MKKAYMLLVLAIVMANCLEESLTMMSLEQMNNLETSQYDCSRPQSEFIQIENSLSQWQDLLEHKNSITHDIKILEEIQANIGIRASHKSVMKQIKKLELPKTKTRIGLAEVEALRDQCTCLKESDNDCDALLKLLTYFILSLRNVQQQCQQNPITVIKIKGKIHDLQVIRAGCGGTIDIGNDEPIQATQSQPQSEAKTQPSNDQQPQPDSVTQPEQEPQPDSQQQDSEPTPDDQKEEATEESAQEESTEESAQEETTEESAQQEPTEESAQEEPTEESVQQEPTEETTQEGPTEETTQEGPTEETTQEGPTEESDQESAEEEQNQEVTNPEESNAEESAGQPNDQVEEQDSEEVQAEEAQLSEEGNVEPSTEEEESEETSQNQQEAAQESEEEEGEIQQSDSSNPEEEEGEAETEAQQPNEETEEVNNENEEENEPTQQEETQPTEEQQENNGEEETLVQSEEEQNPSSQSEEGEENQQQPVEETQLPEEEAQVIEEPTEEIDIEVPEENEEYEEEVETEEEEEEEEEQTSQNTESEEEEEENQLNNEPTPDDEKAEEGEVAQESEEEQSSNTTEEQEVSEEQSINGEEESESEEQEAEPQPEPSQDEEQEVLPEGCRKVPEDVLDVSYESTDPIVVSDLSVNENGVVGLSFYFRWLSKFPVSVPEGIDQAPKFLVAGLGDVLKFYVGNGGFHFSSFNNGVETYKNVGHGDIEGKWVSVYFGIQSGQLTGFAQIEGEDIESVQFDVDVTLSDSYSLTIGGSDGTIPSFNGQIARVFAFNDELLKDENEFNQFITNCYGIPKNIYNGDRLTIPIEKERTFQSTATFDQDSVFENQQPMLPDEYSASGWFKWEDIENQNIWHSGFRWTTNDQATNQNFRNLGDRGLSFFVGDVEHLQGHVGFCTYTYKNQDGKSKTNECKLVKYGNKLTEWFYVYFGYSRHLNKAYGYMEFTHEMAQLEFNDIRHYQAGKIYFYLGQDKFYPPFNGKVQGFMLNFFDGSYRTSSYDYTFGYFPRPVYEYDDSQELIPSQPVQKKQCQKVYDITIDNASDVLCALSNYLAAIAQGHDPAQDPKAETFCFCLVYEEENASPDLLMLVQMLGGEIRPKEKNFNSAIQKLIHQAR